MSTSIDNRIVQMTFDNKQFEAAVKQSMNTLKDLDKTIKEAGSGGAAKGFSGLFEKIKKGFSLSSIADSVETLKDRFSAWGIVGMTVIQNLTNSALNLAKRGLSAINNALFSGGWQRASNLEQAYFRLNAMVGSAEEVAKIMKNVDDAVTGTAFGLDEAAVAASMFAATGMRSGEKMKNTLLGIAGMASTAGVSFQQISDIMVDAAAQNVVTNDTFTRLALQGIPAAIIMADKLGISVEELKKKAKKGEISFEEFAEAMSDHFGAAAQKANETFSGALANMQTAFKRSTEPFFTAFRTGARDIFNTLRDGINEFGAGLGVSLPRFQKFISGISSGIIKIIQDLTKANTIVTKIGTTVKSPSAFKKIGLTITGFFRSIYKLLNDVKKGFDKVFGGSVSDRLQRFIDLIYRLQWRFADWVDKQKIVTEVSTLFFTVLKTGWDVIKAVIDNLGKIISIFKDLSVVVQPVISIFKTLTNGVTTFVEALIKALNELDLIGKIANLIHNTAAVVKHLIDGLLDIILGTIEKFATSASESMEQLMDILINIGIFGLIAWFTDFIKKLGKATKSAKKFIDTLSESIDAIAKIPKKIVQILNQVLKALKKWQQQLEALTLLEIATAVFVLSYALKEIGKLDGKQIARSLGAVAGILIALFSALAFYERVLSPKRVENIGKTLKEKFFDVFKKDELSEFGTAVIKFSIGIYILAKALREIGELDTGGAIRGFIGVGLLMVMMVGVARLLSTNMGILKEERIRKGMTGLILIAVSVKIMASALGQLAEISWSKLENALTAMTLILTEVVVFSRLMSKSSQGLEGGASAKSFILFAISMKIIASALGQLASVDWDGLQNALAAMGLVLFEIGLFSAAASKIGGMKGGASLIAMAAGIYVISLALSNLASIPWETLNNSMTILITLVITLTAVMLAADFGGKGAAAMMVMAIALGMLIVPLMILSGIPIENLASALLALVTTLTVVGVAMAVFSAALVPILVGAAALTGASIAILAFAAALLVLGTAFSAIGAGLTMIATGILAIYNVIKKILADIVHFIGECVASIRDFLGLGQQEIESSGEKLTVTSGTLGADIGNALKNALLKKIKSAFSPFKSGGLSLVTNLISGFKSKISNLPKAVHEGINKAKAKVADFIGGFKTAGINLVKGIANGIKNGASHIFSAVGSIASQALKKFKEKLGISSPSRVFAEEARWIPEGIAVGINKTANKVKNAVEDLATATIDPLSEAMVKAYSVLENDNDFNPTITPILDLSEIRREAGSINSMFGDQSMNLATSIGNSVAQSQQNNAIDRLINKIDKISTNKNNIAPMTNYINVDGAQNPEDFASRLIRSFAMEMRAG